MIRTIVTVLFACTVLAASAAAQSQSAIWTSPSAEQVSAIYPEVESLYLDLHRSPELAMHEQQTSSKLADRAKSLGYEVTTGVGGTVEDKTGLPLASHVVVNSDSGISIPVAHACGHDIHMASWVGTAKLMAMNRDHWHGMLMLIGQPAEETGEGAPAMIKDGYFGR